MMKIKKISGLIIIVLLSLNTLLFAGWTDVTGSGQVFRNVSQNDGASYVPSVAYDSLGHPHIAWFDESEGNMEIFYLKWNGYAWVDADGHGRESINISQNSTISKYPSIAIDPSDRPHIVWEDGGSSNREIYYLKWNGSEWVDADGAGRESINISNSPLDSHHPHFVLDAIGIPHVVWHEGNEKEPPYSDIWYQRRQGGQWVNLQGSAAGSKIIHTTPYPSSWAFLALGPSGVPFVFWSDGEEENREIYMLKGAGGVWVDADGAGTESINISNTPKYSSWPRCDIDSSGFPHVVYEDASPGNLEIFYQKWNGTNWVDYTGSGLAERNISKTHHFSAVPFMKIDNGGNPVIIWQDGAIESCEIRCVRISGGAVTDMAGSQFPFINVSQSPLNSEWAWLDLDADGYPGIAWAEGGLLQPHEIHFLRWMPEGTPTVTPSVTPTFTYDAVSSPTSTPTVSPTFTPTRTVTPTMTVSPLPTAYTGYHDPCWVDADLFGAESRVLGAGEKPSLVFDQAGYPHIAWASGGKIYYLKWNGSAWSDADGTGTESSMISGWALNCTEAVVKLDTAGRPAVAWLAGGDGWRTAYYLKWNGSEWVDCEGTGIDEISVPVNFGGYARNLDFELGLSGLPHITYSDFPENLTHTVRDIFYLKWTGSQWADAGGSGYDSAMITDNTHASTRPSLAISAGGLPAIAWQEAKTGGGFEVRFRQYDGASWNGAGSGVVVTNPAVTDSFQPDLAFSLSGAPHIAFISSIAGNSSPSHLSYTGGYWNDITGAGQAMLQLPAVNTSSGPSVGFGSGGMPAVAWYGQDGIYYLRWNGTSWADAGGWGTSGMRFFGGSGGYFQVSLAHSPSGEPGVAWHDMNMGQPEISFLRYACGVFTPTVTPTVTQTPTASQTYTQTTTHTVTPTVTGTPTPYPEGYFEVIPNPYNPGRGPLRFLNTKPLDIIKIYTVSGEFVNRVEAHTQITYWNGRNRYNREISPGIYYYIVFRDDKIHAKDKIFVVGK